MDDLTALADAVVHGDDRALAELVRRTQQTVRGTCRVLVDADELDDVVQEVYVRVVAGLPGYRFDAPVLPWMLAIARRTCADVVRGRRRRRRLVERISTQRSAVAAPSAEGQVADLLAGLEPDRRLAFYLTQLAGLSYEEAAAVCQCPVGTIRSRVSRARAALVETVRGADSA